MQTPIRLVIAAVFLIGLLSLGGVIVLAAQGMNVPDVLPTVTVAALTGLVGLLVPAGGRSTE